MGELKNKYQKAPTPLEKEILNSIFKQWEQEKNSVHSDQRVQNIIRNDPKQPEYSGYEADRVIGC